MTNDPFYWIPQGLFYDLNDDRNDNDAIPRRVPLVDDVTGYTNQQMFNAFQSSIYNLQYYRINLLQQNNNNQSTGVNSLFSQYGY